MCVCVHVFRVCVCVCVCVYTFIYTHTHTRTRNACTHVQVGVSAGRLEFRADQEAEAPAAASGGFLVREDTSLHGMCVMYRDCAVCHGKGCRDGGHLRYPPCFLVIALAPGCWCVRIWLVWRCSSRAVVLRSCSSPSTVCVCVCVCARARARAHRHVHPCMHARICKCERARTQVADAAAAPMAGADVGASAGFMIREDTAGFMIREDTNFKGFPAATEEMDIFAPSNPEEESSAAPKRRGLRVLDATTLPSETKQGGHQQDAAQDQSRGSGCADDDDTSGARGARDNGPRDMAVPGAPPLPPDAPVFPLGRLVRILVSSCRHDILRTLTHQLTLSL